MADTTDAPAPAKKTPKKKTSKPKKPSAHPKYSEMIKAAIAALKVSLIYFLGVVLLNRYNCCSHYMHMALKFVAFWTVYFLLICSGVHTVHCFLTVFIG